MSKFKAFVENARKGIASKSPELLIGFGLFGFVATSVLTVRATTRAIDKINLEKQKRVDDVEDAECVTLTKKEVTQVCWKEFILPLCTGVLASTCIITSSCIYRNRYSVLQDKNTALATACGCANMALKEYKNKVVETIGEKKAKEIDKKIVEDHVKADEVTGYYIVETGHGNYLWKDEFSGRYFRADTNWVDKQINYISSLSLSAMGGSGCYPNMNDLYLAISPNLEPTTPGKVLGWRGDVIERDPYYTTTGPNGEPCNVLKFYNDPVYGYMDESRSVLDVLSNERVPD